MNASPALVARAHALCSPSSADRWMVCAGSVAMEDDEPDSESEYSREGTMLHEVSAEMLRIGATHAQIEQRTRLSLTEEQREATQAYVDYVRNTIADYAAAGAQVELLTEQKLPLEDVTGERNATGTGDAVLLCVFADGAEIHVIDAKFGRGVEVSDSTRQLPIYALGAVRKFGLMYDFARVHTTVVQPRVNSTPRTVTRSLAELEVFGVEVAERAQLALSLIGSTLALDYLVVTEKGCHFCKAQHKCPALVKVVHDTVFGEMQDIASMDVQAIDETTMSKTDFADLLPVMMAKVPIIEAWCTYVRAKVEQLLLEGKPVAGFKLVTGRAGARKWTDSDAVYPVMMASHVPRELVMVPAELRTPADLEKKVKKAYPGAWDSVQGLITSAPGKPSVAPADDPRPSFAAVFDGESYDSTGLV